VEPSAGSDWLLARLGRRSPWIPTLLERYRVLLGLSVYLVVFATALLVRLAYARFAEFPGHADPAFHYNVARNLVNGRGFEIDYIWHFRPAPPTITHPGNDYWPPLIPLVMSGSMGALGPSMLAALLPGILMGLALSPVVWLWSRACSPSRAAAFGAASLILLEPNLLTASLNSDSIVAFAFLASVALCTMTKGLDDARFFLLAAVGAAFGHLTRLDGLLLLPTLLGVIWTSSHSRRARLAYLVLTPLLYLAVLAPWLLHTYATLGSFLPPASRTLAFVTEYEDLFASTKEASLQTFLDRGLQAIFWSKVDAAQRNVKLLWYLGGVLWIPAGLGILECAIHPRRRGALRRYLPGLLFLAALVVFHTIMPFDFGLTNSAFALIPFLALASIDALRRVFRSGLLALLVIGVLGAHYYARSFWMAGTIVALNNRVGEQLAPLKTIVEHDPGRPRGEEAVVMTRIPWEVNLSTGYKAVQIPNDDFATILAIARRYRVNYLLLPAPREGLAGIYEGTRRDERFQFVAAIPYTDPYLPFMGQHRHLKLFRLVLPLG
jgi:Dolichyl-phosphate-mannose-protein mannosyltransferase